MQSEAPLRPALVAIMAALFGWIVGLVFPLIGPEFAAIVSALAALGAEVAQRLADRGMASPNLRLAELGAAFLIAKIVHLALLGPELMNELAAFPAGLADSETTLGFLLMWFVRSSASKTVRDVRLLGSPGDETVGTAYDRLARRFRTVLGLSTVLGAFAVAGWQQLAILDRPAIDGLVWPLALMLIIGVGSLGAFRRIEDAGRWRRAGARVEERVWLRWGSGVIAITALSAVAVLLFRAGVDEFARVPAMTIRGVAVVGSALLRLLGAGDPQPVDSGNVPVIGDTPTQTTGEGIFDFLQPEETASDASPWEVAVITFAWFLASLGLVALIVAVLRNRRWIRSAFQIGPAEGFRAILGEFLRMLRELGRLLWEMLTFWRPGRSKPGEGADLGEDDGAAHAPARGAWEPPDVSRSRIAAAYHRFLESAARLLPRHRAETPDEYVAAVGDHLPFGGRPADELTGLFVEARYSDHPMEESQIEIAERLSTDLERIVDERVDDP